MKEPINLDEIYKNPEFIVLEQEFKELRDKSDKILEKIHKQFGEPINHCAVPNLNGDNNVVLWDNSLLDGDF